MSDLSFKQRNTEAIVSGLAVCVIWVFITYLSHVGSSWLKPFLFGGAAAGLVLISAIGILILRRIPRARVVPTEKNIEACVRYWLDSHKIAVKNDPSEPCHFRFRITLDGGEEMTVLRMKHEHKEYVQVLSDLGMRGDGLKALDKFTDEEINQVMFDVKVELARGKVGYSGLVRPPENFMLFKRVAIHAGLAESDFLSAIQEVESAMHLVALMYLRMRQKMEERVACEANNLLESSS